MGTSFAAMAQCVLVFINIYIPNFTFSLSFSLFYFIHERFIVRLVSVASGPRKIWRWGRPQSRLGPDPTMRTRLVQARYWITACQLRFYHCCCCCCFVTYYHLSLDQISYSRFFHHPRLEPSLLLLPVPETHENDWMNCLKEFTLLYRFFGLAFPNISILQF